MNLTPLGANKTELQIGDIQILFSYKTPVAARVLNFEGNKYVYYKTSKKWSRTTSKHITQWLNGERADEREQSYFDELVK